MRTTEVQYNQYFRQEKEEDALVLCVYTELLAFTDRMEWCGN